MIVAYLTHFSSIIYFLYLIYFKFFEKKVPKNFKTIILLTILAILGSLFMYSVFAEFFSSTKFNGYLDKEISLLGYIPILILFVIMLIYRKDLLKDKNDWFIYSLVLFNILVLPISILVGAANRVLIFFMIPRLILWARFENVLLSKAHDSKNKLFIKIIFFIIFLIWFVFRIYKGWKGNGLMPYYNDILNYLFGW